MPKPSFSAILFTFHSHAYGQFRFTLMPQKVKENVSTRAFILLFSEVSFRFMSKHGIFTVHKIIGFT